MLGFAGLGLSVGLRMTTDARTDTDKALAGVLVYVSGFRIADTLFRTTQQ